MGSPAEARESQEHPSDRRSRVSVVGSLEHPQNRAISDFPQKPPQHAPGSRKNTRQTGKAMCPRRQQSRESNESARQDGEAMCPWWALSNIIKIVLSSTFLESSRQSGCPQLSQESFGPSGQYQLRCVPGDGQYGRVGDGQYGRVWLNPLAVQKLRSSVTTRTSKMG
ncbi:hypothetical protein THAOC_15976 [Thalassiosira oceanica]|uniref:Uncharacterized protein n=1 Tax=Thalassiosira oceanica TaxID=159749 RepID=K0SB64_THAOC|nr:hypothetical protein THAOC_15976 [Thalassiosira oceanica]|eukprot:EJK63368.1 hypothetical protein THAOC_15976 [Thalassiosira oceanica]